MLQCVRQLNLNVENEKSIEKKTIFVFCEMRLFKGKSIAPQVANNCVHSRVAKGNILGYSSSGHMQARDIRKQGN